MADTSSTVLSARDGGVIRELRLALVCYGGVSLAIYMHGVTKEIHKLVLASAALEGDRGRNPFASDDSAAVYWDLLKRMHESRAAAGDDARTRVVVDIISGASAGGINGVFLAKALAENRSQDSLRQMWFDKGDIKQLIRGPKWLPLWGRIALWIPKSIRGVIRVKPPLRGDEMCTWLHQALDGMDVAPSPLGGLTSLIPEDQTLSLHVPVTDFHGYPIEVPIDDPRVVRDRSHRHVMDFVHDGKARRQFASTSNHALAFAARATSSFPGAFPPLTIADYESSLGGGRLDEVWADHFPHHRVAGIDPRDAFFIDGGVLDNFPFATSISAIKARRAWTEVDRRLIFIEPDPVTEAAGTRRGKAPSWYATVFGGYAGIPRKEPIADDLFALSERNGTVRAIRDIIASGFDAMRDRVAQLVGGEQELIEAGKSPSVIGRDRVRAGNLAEERAGFAYTTYVRMRISGVIDEYARLIAQVRALPDRSIQAIFVADVLRAWARAQGLFAQEADPTKEQREFLEQLDASFHDRRLRFLLAAVNWWYRDVGTEGYPTREQLDQAKTRLYGRVRTLSTIPAKLRSDPEVARIVGDLFSGTAIVHWRESGESTEEFVSQHQGELVALRDRAGFLIGEILPDLERSVDEDVIAITAPWSPDVRRDFLVRYLGFPFWDILVHPVAALADVNERDEVEVMRISPMERRLLLREDRTRDPLIGARWGHFGAFFSRKARQHDYLWGRLDTAERLIALLFDDPEHPGVATPDPKECAQAFEAILRNERESLTAVRSTLENLMDRVNAL